MRVAQLCDPWDVHTAQVGVGGGLCTGLQPVTTSTLVQAGLPLIWQQSISQMVNQLHIIGAHEAAPREAMMARGAA